MRLAINRSRLEVARRLVDMLVCPEGQDHSANIKTMPKLSMNTRCSTECHGHLCISSGGQTLQIRVSLDIGDGGKVSLARPGTC